METSRTSVSCCMYNAINKIFVIIITVIVILVPIPVLCFFYILRQTVALLGKFILGLKIVPLFDTCLAGENVYGKEALTTSVTFVADVPSIQRERVMQKVQENLLEKRDRGGNLQFPELKCALRPFLGYLFWKPVKKFKLEDHVINYEDTELPIPDWSDPNALRKIASQVLRYRGWRKDAPLWEIILLSNVPKSHLPKNSRNGSLFVWRYHHVLLDGYGTFKVLMQLFDKYDKVKDSVVPSTLSIFDEKLTWRKLQSICTAPFKLAEICLPLVLCPLKIPPIFNGNGNKILSSATIKFPLADLKAIRMKHNVDLTSILVAIISGGVRRFLLKNNQNLPNKLGIMCPMPMPNHPDKLTNHVSGGIFPIPLREPNNISLLREISLACSTFRDKSIVPLGHFIGKLAGLFPQFVILTHRNLFSLPPLFLANLVGPVEKLWLDDIPIMDIKMGANIPKDGARGFCFAFLTYEGEANLSVSAFNEYLESNQQADDLLEYCWEEMKELES
ncbi:uncharacterized protein LOC110860872 isoform X1 [Folsomia candida]|uniref:uncharacterized protein LOC110860872 isoform X1 n=2 Tax=Folsomia candida TaxID=158441 RepID=UPI001604CC8E|nr:uncharacterized protein LOC110860872 isoform X1 [Folsomia candida]